MSRGVNKVILIGNLGEDPEINHTGDGTAVCNMSLATNESYTNANGEEVQKTEWHNVVAWERLAEVCHEYLSKGSQVYFEGKLQTRSWEDSDGNTRYTTQVKVREMMFLDSNRQQQNGTPQPQRQDPSQGAPTQNEDPPRESGEGEQTFEPVDELPF